jgi:phosphopantothenoylcysteine decarboxylase/phosphopantothenate--cysteine ligase
LATLSKNPILVDFFDPENGAWNSHVDLGLWADAMVIAPATANTMGKMVAGVADNLLITTYLSARCKVFVAPTMDLDMYQHPSTQRNLASLHEDGVAIIEATSGELASGLHGKGRMAEPEYIFDSVASYFAESFAYAGKKVLVTAGPTYEPIDPVRFVGNYSSGKMGFALAEVFAQQGAEVILVSGPTHLETQQRGVKLVRVNTAAEMLAECESVFCQMDLAVMAAAVADYTPSAPENLKIKRTSASMEIQLRPTVDIAARLGGLKTVNQRLVGFALETNDGLQNALAKLKRKNLDLIVLNTLEDVGAGFGHDTNKVSVVWADGQVLAYELKSKQAVAVDIVASVLGLWPHF